MFRFTIRDLLWLTVVVALGVGWLLEHRVAKRVQDELDYERALLQVEKDYGEALEAQMDRLVELQSQDRAQTAAD